MRKLSNLIQAILFYVSVTFTKLKDWWRPLTKQHKKVKITKIALKEGESYRLGECIVTLAKFGIEGKKEVAEKLKHYEELRLAKEKELTDKGIQIMLMSPEELEQFQVNEWLKKSKTYNSKKLYDSLKDPDEAFILTTFKSELQKLYKSVQKKQ